MFDLNKIKPIIVHHIINKIDNPVTSKDDNFTIGHIDEQLWSKAINIEVQRGIGKDFVDGTSFKFFKSENLILSCFENDLDYLTTML
jgi:hypothetical protein